MYNKPEGFFGAACKMTQERLTYHELHRVATHCASRLPLGTVCSGLRRGNDFYALLLACSFREQPFVAMSVDLPEAKRVARCRRL